MLPMLDSRRVLLPMLDSRRVLVGTVGTVGTPSTLHLEFRCCANFDL